jgi:hypothetical protein
VITAVALLIAQFGAMAHAYSHDSGIARGAAHQSNPGSHDFCGDCLNFAPLLASAGSPTPLPVLLPQARSVGPRAAGTSLVDHPRHLAFRSRAPPVR